MGRPALSHILASFALIFAVAGCDVGEFPVEGGGGGADGGGGTLPLTFNGQIQQDVAVCTACHGAGLQEGNYRVDSYGAITGNGSDGTANVIPNDVGSLLIVEIDPAQAPRVEHTAYATAQRVQLYTDWINAGAPEN